MLKGLALASCDVDGGSTIIRVRGWKNLGRSTGTLDLNPKP